jgi:GT2 family glycosyltransferase
LPIDSNEEATIGAVIAKTKEALPNRDLVVVNDGSTDRTAEIIQDNPARLVSLPCNLGYSSAEQHMVPIGGDPDDYCQFGPVQSA